MFDDPKLKSTPSSGKAEDIFEPVDHTQQPSIPQPQMGEEGETEASDETSPEAPAAKPLVVKRDPDIPSPFQPVAPSGTPEEPLSPVEVPAAVASSALMMDSPAFSSKKMIFVLVALVVIGGGAFAGWRFLKAPLTDQPSTPNVTDDQTPSDIPVIPETPVDVPEDTPTSELLPVTDAPSDRPTEPAPDIIEPPQEPGAFPNLPPDKDADGLPDAEEALHGTNPLSSDTDGDGLFDREEVKTWKTDPTNSDTDGDTYLDGEEVTLGYNPNGPGRLQEIP